MERLPRSFFTRDTITVAQELLGKVLVRKIGEKEIRARIVETEAYIGEEDQACHARFGRTKRNAVMYGVAGHAYIYLCYGIHELLNIVTERELAFGSTPKAPAAVLIRRIIALEYDRTQNAYLRSKMAKILGPGSLTKYLQITRALNGEDLTKSGKLWIAKDDYMVKKSQIKSAERIGVAYAGKWAKRRWRFYFDF